MEEDLCHLHFTTIEHEIGKESLERILAAILEHMPTKKCFMIISTEPGASMNQEARDFASSEAFDAISLADAILRADYNHEMAANFFIRFNRPKRPVRLFPNLEHALTWIKGLRDGQSL